MSETTKKSGKKSFHKKSGRNKPAPAKKNVSSVSRDIERSGDNVIVKISHIDHTTHKEASKATYAVRFAGVEKLVEYPSMHLAREGAKGEAPIVEAEAEDSVSETEVVEEGA